MFLCIAAAAIALQPPPTFKAGVELVRMDVRVTDAQGRPVRDLRQSEIEVVENGDVRPVVFFQHIEEPTDSYEAVARRTVAGEVSTNQGAARGHLYVLVFDQQHITPGNEPRARQAAARFLETRIRPGDRVALYAVPGPGPQIGFTADARRVARELARVHGIAESSSRGNFGTMTVNEAFQILRGNQAVFQRVADRMQAETESDSQRQKHLGAGSDAEPYTALVREDAETLVARTEADTRRTLAMLSDLMRQMRPVEGRKAILFVSEGFNGERLTREIEDVAAAAAQSYSVVYAVDINRHEGDAVAGEPTDADPSIGLADRLAPLGSLASETAGRLVNDANGRLDAVFGEIADESQDYYLIGFTPRDAALKDRGTYRRVTVRIRRPDVRASTRSGFALTPATASLDRRQSIDRALAAPFPLQGLPVRYTTYLLRGSSSGMQRIILSLAAGLPLATPVQAHPADVIFVVRSAADGHVAAGGSDVIALPDRADRDGTTGVGVYRVQFELPAGEYLMRAIVREPDGLIGSADRRLVVRTLDGPSIASGDLILSSERGGLPVRPTAYTGGGLSGVLELYGRTPEQLRDARVTVDLLPMGEDTAVVSGAADLQEIVPTTSGASRAAQIELPLQGIAAGAYLARARVTVGADTVTELVREVEVRQGEHPAADDGPDTAPLDPREIANGALAREFAKKVGEAGSPIAVDAARGLERLAARDYPAAIGAFQAVLDANPQSGAAAFLLGWAFHGAGDDRQAISAWRRAAFIDPTMVPAHLALADTYVRLSQPALAVQALRAGLVALPQSPELLDRLNRLERPR